MTNSQIRVGIGGWDYRPVARHLLSEGPGQDEAARASPAEQLTAIEVNATYYRSQKPATFANWAKAVPDGFKFAVKASRFATNRKVLADGAEVDRAIPGPGNHRARRSASGRSCGSSWRPRVRSPTNFAAFLKLLPEKQDGVRLRHALEARHESFRDPAFFALAQKANAAIVFADSDQFPEIEEPTADFTYARLQRCVEEFPTGYDEKALDRWAKRAKAWQQRGDVYVFFISGAKVRAPAAALALAGAAGHCVAPSLPPSRADAHRPAARPHRPVRARGPDGQGDPGGDRGRCPGSSSTTTMARC